MSDRLRENVEYDDRDYQYDDQPEYFEQPEEPIQQEHNVNEHPVAVQQIPEEFQEATIREDRLDYVQQPQLTTQPEAIASYEHLPLSSARVMLPENQDYFIFTHLIYPAKFIWNGREFDIQRRYSDFDALRRAIKHFLPFSYVFPAHKKQFFVG